jgi:Family of unknown function (DUF7009)
MKVRWTGESLRLRITPAELAALERGAAAVESLAVPGGGRWSVRLEPRAGASGVAWDDGVVRVGLDPGDLARLAAPDAEGVYPHGDGLRLLVEKDFPCAHPHAPEAREPATERFPPTPAFLDRKTGGAARD